MSALAENSVQESRQFLTFLLNDQEYGLDISKIREIRGYAPITPIPNVPPHVRGVMNLRGTILPVIDLRIRFHLPAVEYNNFTVIVIAAIGGKTVGLLVDAVCDVLMIAQDAMRQAPDFGAAVDTRFMNGVFESRKHLTVALDLEELLSDSAVALPQSIAA